MGSGLLRKTPIPAFKDEPDVKKTLLAGIDLVCFSGDKLLGGPQAGIIAGKAKLIALLKKEPMVRALRVGKTTLAYMEAALKYYLDDDNLIKNNTIFSTLHQTAEELLNKASRFQKGLSDKQIPSEIIDSKGYCGGGALPGASIPSKAVKIMFSFKSGKARSAFSEKVFYGLLKQKTPIISILKKGEVILDMLTIQKDEVDKIVDIVSHVIHENR